MKKILCFYFLTLLLGSTAQATDVLIASMISTPATGVINGATFTESIEVTTVQGQGASANVNLSYTPPPGTTVQSFTITSDLGSPPVRSCNTALNPVTCSLATVRDRLPPATDGERVTVSFVLLVSDPSITTTTVLTHNASVTATIDTNTANNAGSNTTTVIPGADVRLNNNAYMTAPASGTAGAPVTFNISPENFGPNAATRFEVQTTFTGTTPAFNSFSGSGWTCGAFVSPNITCTFSGSVASGASAPSLNLTVTPSTNGTLTTQASVLSTPGSATPADPNTGNNGVASRSVSINPGADLVITGLSAPASIALANPFNYTFTAQNNGPNNASTNTVTIPIPSGTTINSITAAGWSCLPTLPRSNPPTTQIQCTRPTFNAATSTLFTINTTADTIGAKLLNPSISSSTADPNLTNNSQSTTVTAANNANLSISKIVSGSNFFNGDTFSYTINAQSLGPATVTGSNNITLTDNLPANVRLLSFSQSGGTASSFTWSCSPALPVDGPTTVTCNANVGASVAAGQTMPTLTFNVEAIGLTTSRTQVQRTNNASISSSLIDPTPGNNNAATTVTLYSNTGDGSDGPGGTADITIVKDDFQDVALSIDLAEPVGLNQDFYYLLRVRNNSSGIFFNLNQGILTVTDTLPAGLSLFAAEGVVSGEWNCSPTSGSGPLTITCTRNLSTHPLANSTNTDIRLQVRGTATGTPVNTSSVSYSAFDFNSSNNSDSENTAIASPIADVTITKTASPSSVIATGLLTYTLTIANAPCPSCTMSTATAVRVVDELISVFDNDFSATSTQGSCTVTNISGTATNRRKRVVCELGDLAYNSSATVTIQLRPRNTSFPFTRNNDGFAYTPNPVRNYFDPATVFSGSDPAFVRNALTGAIGYNRASTSSTITAGSDVRIIKTTNPTTGRGGTPFVFTLNVRNNGPSQATGLTVTDTLPIFGAPGSSQGFEFTGTSPFTSGGYSCTYTAGSDPNPNIGGTVSCTRATLNNATENNIAISVRPTNFIGATINIDNIATVTSTSADGITVNNSSSSAAGIQEAQADLVITKTDRPQSRDPAVVGDNFFYTLTITNNGPSRAQGVTVTDTLPTETGSSGLLASFVSATPLQGSCSPPSGGILTCNLGDLEVGASTTITITMNANQAGTVNNNASVSSSRSVDPVAGNNSEGETTTLRDPADLILTKTVSPSPVQSLKLLTYTLTVTNDPTAPGAAFESYVREILPLGATFISATPSQGTCPQQPASNATIIVTNQTLNCRLGTLNPGASATITVVLRAPNQVTSLTNSAIVNDINTLSSEGLSYDAERDLTDNRASVVTQVIGYGIFGSIYRDLQPNSSKDVGEDWNAAGNPTLQVKLTTRNVSGICQSPALAFATVAQGSGDFGFPTPQGSPTGDYCLIVTNSPVLTNITPFVPSGWLLTEPNNNIPVRNITLGQGAVTNENFGFFRSVTGGVRLSGRVFDDNGQGGGIAHDGLVNGGERGLPVVNVAAYAGSNCTGTPLATTSTIGNGSFDFFVNFTTPLTLCADTPVGFRSISENIGTTGASNPNVFDSAITFTPSNGQSYSGINFGKVGEPLFRPDYQAAIAPGGSESYAHVFYTSTAGSVSFSATNQEIPNLNGWNSLLYRDINCDAQVNPGEPQISGSIALSANSSLCLVNRVFAPIAAPYNAAYLNTIRATFTYFNTSQTSTLQVVDRTTTSDASSLITDIALRKTVDRTQAYPGETLTYTITYENQGSSTLSNLVINDATPTFTTFVSATCGSLGSGFSGCSVSRAPSVGNTGSIEWRFTGNLNAGAVGNVVFRVRLNN